MGPFWKPKPCARTCPGAGMSARSFAVVGGRRLSLSVNLLKYFAGTYHGTCGFANPTAMKNGRGCAWLIFSIAAVAMV